MKKQLIIALGAVMLLSGCNGGDNITPEESEVNIPESVSESTSESGTNDITTTSEDLSEAERDPDITVSSTEKETAEQTVSDSELVYHESESGQSLIEPDDTESFEIDKTQESETAVYEFDDFLERDND